MGWQVAWIFIAPAVALGLMGWGTFALIHADEARSRRREAEMKKNGTDA